MVSNGGKAGVSREKHRMERDRIEKIRRISEWCKKAKQCVEIHYDRIDISRVACSMTQKKLNDAFRPLQDRLVKVKMEMDSEDEKRNQLQKMLEMLQYMPEYRNIQLPNADLPNNREVAEMEKMANAKLDELKKDTLKYYKDLSAFWKRAVRLCSVDLKEAWLRRIEHDRVSIIKRKELFLQSILPMLDSWKGKTKNLSEEWYQLAVRKIKSLYQQEMEKLPDDREDPRERIRLKVNSIIEKLFAKGKIDVLTKAMKEHVERITLGTQEFTRASMKYAVDALRWPEFEVDKKSVWSRAFDAMKKDTYYHFLASYFGTWRSKIKNVEGSTHKIGLTSSSETVVWHITKNIDTQDPNDLEIDEEDLSKGFHADFVEFVKEEKKEIKEEFNARKRSVDSMDQNISNIQTTDLL